MNPAHDMNQKNGLNWINRIELHQMAGQENIYTVDKQEH